MKKKIEIEEKKKTIALTFLINFQCIIKTLNVKNCVKKINLIKA